MKLTLRRLVSDAAQMGAIANKQGLPKKISYAIAKNMAKIESELKIYNSERQKLIDKYAHKDEQGNVQIDRNNNLKIMDEHIKDWNKEINELLDVEVNVEIHKFNIDDLYNSDCDMTPYDFILIDYMIED
ncbi:DUF1617 family protein [Paraclostridium bifermentans]|uniref:DUF1617 family protein n=1 Tax=Paraclostridium bifermentans TaxID=1490 RepID=UPI001C1097EB|nr:DUF1617 family protein [Paraclostridium bifermentans]MBU5288178.1 DUF1617 family protein [Paraclostridium bifermentans]